MSECPGKLPNVPLTVICTVAQVILWIIGGIFFFGGFSSDSKVWWITNIPNGYIVVSWLIWTVAFPVYWWGIRSKRHDRIRSYIRGHFFNGLEGRQIKDALAFMPRPTKSEKHSMDSFITYYWTSTPRNFNAFPIPGCRGLRIFEGGDGIEQSFVLQVDPETSKVIGWEYRD